MTTAINIEPEKRTCLCCKNTFWIEPFIEQEFCNRCFPIVCREVFDKNNGSLTIEELKEKIQTKIKEADNGTGY